MKVNDFISPTIRDTENFEKSRFYWNLKIIAHGKIIIKVLSVIKAYIYENCVPDYWD